VRARLRAGFTEMGAVYSVLEREGADRLGESYEVDGVVIEIELDERGLEDLGLALADATRGRVAPELIHDG
jgi:hypothetical protein